VQIGIVIPGLRGAETDTPTSTQGCTPREDWTLEYEVQRDDALARIAERYGTSVQALAEANCLTDVDMIVIGQRLNVPGTAHPAQPIYDCTWELLTPVDNTLAIAGEGQITFNWRGPEAPRNLIRIVPPEGSGQGIYEIVLELRQNEVLDLQDIPAAGTYTWYVYPLDQNFVQIPCREGGPWRFTKKLSPPTETPTPTGQALAF
jgi:LysM repeat protein